MCETDKNPAKEQKQQKREMCERDNNPTEQQKTAEISL